MISFPITVDVSVWREKIFTNFYKSRMVSFSRRAFMLFSSFSFSKEFHLDSQDWAVCLHVSPSKAETNPERGIGIRRGA